LNWNLFIGRYGSLVAFVIFLLAALTDLIDGRIARSRKLVSNLGKFLDPIADKLLVISVLIALAQLGRLHALPIIIIIFREFLITGIRLAASDKGVVIAASHLGKAKTVAQIIAILVILGEKLLASLFCPAGSAGPHPWPASPILPILQPGWIRQAADWVMIAAVILTLVSGIDYLWKNRTFLKE
jgi:CDP-diacylglycerol--glycerol-3-phosphate 3-phosphatidyltransferase/cardiolipin synthase